MSDISNRDFIYRKSFLVQVYKTVSKEKEGTSKKINFRQFIYNKKTYDFGGLFCYARDITDSESISSGLAVSKDNMKFRFNSNDLITNDCKIIFKGKTYNIQSTPDRYEYNTRGDVVVNATAVIDNLKYEGNLYMED